MSSQALVDSVALTSAVLSELASAMGTLIGAPGTVAPSADHVQPDWAVTIAVGDPAPGALTVGLLRDDCARLVSLARGDEGESPDVVIVELLQELVGQTVSALRDKPAGKGLLFCVEAPAPLTALPAEPPGFHVIQLTETFAPVVAVWTVFESTSTASMLHQDSSVGGRAAMSVVRSDKNTAAAGYLPANLDVILDIDLPLSVRFGQTELSLEALTRLGPGSVIDLGRSPDDPVDVLVNGRLVARAEVVVVAGNYGVRILEVVSAADRVRSLGI